MTKIVLIKAEVILFLDELVTLLVEKEYFSFPKNAEIYVNKLYDAIYDLPSLKHYETPQELIRYGKYYVKIKGSKQTMWYVFFDKMDNRYLVEFITNNHSPQSECLNKL